MRDQHEIVELGARNIDQVIAWVRNRGRKMLDFERVGSSIFRLKLMRPL